LDHIVHIKFLLENQYESIYEIQHEFLFHINLIMVLECQQAIENKKWICQSTIRKYQKQIWLDKQMSFKTINGWSESKFEGLSGSKKLRLEGYFPLLHIKESFDLKAELYNQVRLIKILRDKIQSIDGWQQKWLKSIYLISII